MNNFRKAFVTTCAALLIISCGQVPEPTPDVVRPLRVMKLGDLTNLSGRSFPGRAAALQEVDLSFRVDGPLITFPVKVGDEVAAGDVVARIDPRDFEISALTVEGELERANAERVLATREYKRAQDAEAKNPDLISESELDRRLGARDRARANVKALEAALQAANDELAYSHLRAPFPGTVVNTYVENFETVRSEQPIVRVVDTTRIEFTINIPETLISILSTVRNIRVSFDAFPDVEVQPKSRRLAPKLLSPPVPTRSRCSWTSLPASRFFRAWQAKRPAKRLCWTMRVGRVWSSR